MSSYHFYPEANPWKNTKAGDCVIRSISTGTNIPYEKVCEMFGKKCEEGFGLKGDITLAEILKFISSNKNILELKYIDRGFLDYVYHDKKYVPSKKVTTIKEFTDGVKGNYILFVRRNDVQMDHEYAREVFKNTFHAIYVNGSKKEYFDNMRNDPGDMVIYGVVKVKDIPSKNNSKN